MRRSQQGSVVACMAALAIATAPVTAADPGWGDPTPAPGEPTSQEENKFTINYQTGGEHQPSEESSAWPLLAISLVGGSVIVAWQRRRKLPGVAR